MRLFLCLLASLLLHGMLLMARAPASARPNEPPSRLEVKLSPLRNSDKEPPQPDALASLPRPDDSEPGPAAAPAKATAISAKTRAPSVIPETAVIRQARRKLMEQLLYPPQAIAQELEGEVVLLLSLDAGGRVTSASVARTSGHALLDAAALNAVRALGPLRPSAREILLPVEFSLD